MEGKNLTIPCYGMKKVKQGTFRNKRCKVKPKMDGTAHQTQLKVRVNQRSLEGGRKDAENVRGCAEGESPTHV